MGHLAVFSHNCASVKRCARHDAHIKWPAWHRYNVVLRKAKQILQRNIFRKLFSNISLAVASASDADTLGCILGTVSPIPAALVATTPLVFNEPVFKYKKNLQYSWSDLDLAGPTYPAVTFPVEKEAILVDFKFCILFEIIFFSFLFILKPTIENTAFVAIALDIATATATAAATFTATTAINEITYLIFVKNNEQNAVSVIGNYRTL
uniref:Uncharacterized protein n=1 Tax=Glossina pallidipes TaxID=7398 RepID=A0A1A9ZVD9_GLOPL